jgi:hypothetical protein
MLSTEKLKEGISKYTPTWIVIPVVYLIGFLSVIWFVICLPLIPIYYFSLCIGAWFFLPGLGKDVLVVSNGKGDAEPWLSQITLMVKERALFLNYEEHENWPRWSLTVMLLHAFGPSGKPASFIRYSLPAVLLMRRFRLPTHYSFGERARDKETKLDELKVALGSVPGPNQTSGSTTSNLR